MAGISLSGTTLRCEDDTNGDASLDGIAGSYSFKDFAIKDGVNCVDLATSHQSYRGVASIQIGDGGSAVTSLQDTNASIIFDASRSLATSAASGVSGRTLRLGSKIVGANGKPTGRDGCKVVQQASGTLRGIVQLYATHIRQQVGTFAIQPGASGLACEIVDCILEALGGVALGVTGQELALIYNLDITLLGTLTSHAITQWNVLNAERVTVMGNTPYLISTAGSVRVRDLVMGGTPTISDLHKTGSTEWDLVEPFFTAAAPQVDLGTGFVNQWWRFLPHVVDIIDRSNVANCPVRLLDVNGAELLPTTYTSSQGLITYGGTDPITKDTVKVRRGTGSPFVWTEFSPVTARFNLDGAVLPKYTGLQVTFPWPRLTGAFGDQFLPCLDEVPLVPRGQPKSGQEDWRPAYA